ncbi:hypothetical protein ABES33_23825 [Bacillus pseudomycoides]|uniref:hypothetical protein n=1 Tax=Bacillus pseudomycoides TaxID=64104 RepID=UPI0001A14A29|nr:hypothetical protein [Bacillus pseudomycoides]EEM02407.1 NADPH-dependent FMN reductase [Bacillus pseudomycoides]PGC34222.1 hypothetical protein COM18_24670 [Bacillus pseudomycoides]
MKNYHVGFVDGRSLEEYNHDTKLVGMITLASTSKHFLVGEIQLKPIRSFFKAIVASNNVFIPSKSFNEQNQIDETDIITRIDNLVSEPLFLQNKLKG